MHCPSLPVLLRIARERDAMKEAIVVKRLHDISGKHIANVVRDQLHSPEGKNVGHFLERYDIFIDMSGRYLGEIYSENRLLFNRNSAYKTMNFGAYGNYGNVGNYGNPGNIGRIGSPYGFEDVDPSKLS
jgi:hypothetical protein